MAKHQPADLEFDTLTRYRERKFLPPNADLTDKDTVVALYEKLLERRITNADELEAWLLDDSELGSALSQVSAILYIRMTCQTDDEERSKAYRNFIETIPPAVKPIGDRINRKYLKERKLYELDENRYMVHDRSVRAEVELFREDNVPLQTEVSLLSQEYQTISGAMTVRFREEELTMQQMAKFLFEPDRALREGAWRETAQRRLRDKDKLGDIFSGMLQRRRKIAANADCSDYEDYAFRSCQRFDYTPADCEKYHDAVEKRVVPLWREILLKRRETMGLASLRPWDTSVDPHSRPPLKPFDDVNKLIDGTRKIFNLVDPELGKQFEEIDRLGLLDLASRKGKAPGGYQSDLNEARKPFIFMNAVGLDDDIRTMLHESGHAFHALAAADEDLLDYRESGMEFCEVASMSMELLAGDHLSVFYSDEQLARSRREHLEGIIMLLPWVATVDAFQHWIYANPEHTRDERTKAWLKVFDRFNGGVVDWSGLEEQKAHRWHRQLHIFEYPFYYIEYGIAQLGALQLWVRAKKDHSKALADYRKALALGGSRPLPELFASAGIKFDFSEDTIAPLVDAVAEELNNL